MSELYELLTETQNVADGAMRYSLDHDGTNIDLNLLQNHLKNLKTQIKLVESEFLYKDYDYTIYCTIAEYMNLCIKVRDNISTIKSIINDIIVLRVSGSDQDDGSSTQITSLENQLLYTKKELHRNKHELRQLANTINELMGNTYPDQDPY